MASTPTIPRHASTRVEAALKDTRIVTVEGPRQAGKSTLCRAVAVIHGMPSITLDDFSAREAANQDPAGFVTDLGAPAFIDELQRAPTLTLALKEAVDQDRGYRDQGRRDRGTERPARPHEAA